MAKLLILLLLLAGLGLYVRRQRQQNYGMAQVTTPNGEMFEAVTLPDDCRAGPCIKRMGYLTRSHDTVAMKEEAPAPPHLRGRPGSRRRIPSAWPSWPWSRDSCAWSSRSA
ncbi:MAG: hypothetical protein IPK12_01175 [Gemmatimonadetes bacterium]|nr:hypothetical protein [Gemmatimonadota bacterium]